MHSTSAFDQLKNPAGFGGIFVAIVGSGRAAKMSHPENAIAGLSRAAPESCWYKVRTSASDHEDATMIKFLSIAAILSATFATPVFAQAADQEPGATAFYQSLGAVGSGAGPEPAPASHNAYASLDRDISVEQPTSCAQRYRSFDPSSGTFLGYDGMRHPCQ
jgi:BA14K-like protein